MKISEALLLLIATVIVTFLAYFVRKLSVWGYKIAAGIAKPLKDMTRPMTRALRSLSKKLDTAVYSIYNAPRIVAIFGSWKLQIFMIFATLFIIIQFIVALISGNGSDFFERIFSNTLIGSIGMLGKSSFSIPIYLRLLFTAAVTDFFMKHCCKIKIGAQILYSIIFIIFCATAFELLPDTLFNFVPDKWWAMFQVSGPSLNSINAIDSFVPAVLQLTLSIWGTLLNWLLVAISVYIGILILIRAVGDIVSSWLCSIAAFLFIFSVGSLIQLLNWDSTTIDILLALLALFCVVGFELFVLHFDTIFSLVDSEVSTIVKEDDWEIEEDVINQLPYNWLTVFIAGYFGSPFFYLFVLLIILLPETDLILHAILLIIVFLALFVICCIPGIILICKRVFSRSARAKHIFILMLKGILYIPILILSLLWIPICLIIFRTPSFLSRNKMLEWISGYKKKG